MNFAEGKEKRGLPCNKILLLLMENIYVINLQHRTDILEKMKEIFGDFNRSSNNFQFFNF